MRKELELVALLTINCAPQKEMEIPDIPKIEISSTNTEIKEQENSYNETYQPKICQKIDLQVGLYFIKFNEEEKRFYNVGTRYPYFSEDGDLDSKYCTLNFIDAFLSHIVDEDCNNLADKWIVYPASDRWITYDQEDLKEKGLFERFNQLLKDAQQYVCPENKEKSKELMLKEILKNYQ